MRGPIPDLSKPTSCMIALRERREQSIADGNKLVAEYLPKSQPGARDYLPESKPVEIEPEVNDLVARQMRDVEEFEEYNPTDAAFNREVIGGMFLNFGKAYKRLVRRRNSREYAEITRQMG